jgi:50S ribosomal protein L16 3-hydroxylase
MPARHAGEIPPALTAHVARTLEGIRWDDSRVRDFTGRYLSEPKRDVVFQPPEPPLPLARFVARAAKRGLALDRRSRLLFSGSMFYMNGEPAKADAGSARVLRRLADRRRLAAPVEAPRAFWEQAYRWYAQGFVHVAKEDEDG